MSKITLVNQQTGATLDVDPDIAGSYIGGSSPWTEDTPELKASRDAIAAKSEELNSPLSQAETGLESFANTATLGLSHLAETGLGVNPEDIKARKEANPISNMLGTGAGFVIPGAAVEGALGKTAAKIAKWAPINLLNKVGEAAGEGIAGANFLPKLLKTAVGKAAAKEAADVATQSAIYNVADQIDENHLNGQDLPTAIENTLATTKGWENTGLSAVLGGLVGGAVPVLASGAKTALQKAADGFAKYAGWRSGVPEEEIGKYTSGLGEAPSVPYAPGADPTSYDYRQNLIKPQTPEQRDIAAKTIAKSLQDAKNSLDKIAAKSEEIFGTDIENTLKAVPNTEPIKQASEMGSKLQKAADNLIANPQNYSPGLARNLQDISTKYNTTLNEMIAPRTYTDFTQAPTEVASADIYKLMNHTKQELQANAKYNALTPFNEKEAQKQFKSIASQLKTALEDNNVWGAQGANQSALNSAISDYLTAVGKKGITRKKFLTEVAGTGWVFDPTKINTSVNKAMGTTARSVLDKEGLETFLSAGKRLADQWEKASQRLSEKDMVEPGIKSLMDTASEAKASQPLNPPVYDRPSELQKLYGNMDKAANNIKDVQFKQSAQAKLRASAPFNLNPKLPFAAHLGAGTVAAMGHPLVGLGLEAINFGSNPVSELKILAHLENASLKVNKIINSDMASFFHGKTALAESVSVKPKDYQKDLNKHAAILGDTSFVANDHHNQLPEQLIQTAPAFANGLSSKATQLKISNATAFPKNPHLPGLGIKNYTPSKMELAEFANLQQLNTQPLSLLNKMRTGTMTDKDVKTVATNYPGIYKNIVQAAQKQLISHPKQLTRNQENMLNKLMQIPNNTGLSQFAQTAFTPPKAPSTATISKAATAQFNDYTSMFSLKPTAKRK